ncbi:MAG TPA: hypothetical protein VK638_00665 [Edaphobacter sp.]|nr:hypothetical protein [Edaphobacter sp.]
MKAGSSTLKSPAAESYTALSLRLQSGLLAALTAEARRMGMNRTSCIVWAINEWLDGRKNREVPYGGR